MLYLLGLAQPWDTEAARLGKARNHEPYSRAGLTTLTLLYLASCLRHISASPVLVQGRPW